MTNFLLIFAQLPRRQAREGSVAERARRDRRGRPGRGWRRERTAQRWGARGPQQTINRGRLSPWPDRPWDKATSVCVAGVDVRVAIVDSVLRYNKS
jgi:hypothetical protein